MHKYLSAGFKDIGENSIVIRSGYVRAYSLGAGSKTVIDVMKDKILGLLIYRL